jgi:thiopurine S-methyltransferase
LLPEFWLNRWHDQKIGFHQTVVEHDLQEFWPRCAPPAGATVLVPLCGKSLDLLWLRARGHRVLGAELSSIAVEQFCLENAVPARRRQQGMRQEFTSDGLSIICDNLFRMSTEEVGHIAAVYDRAALISFNPDMRKQYVHHLTRLTHTGTRTLLLGIEFNQKETAGPPFSLSPQDVEALYASHHDIVPLSRRDILAQDARMRDRGVTRLNQTTYLLIRR